MMYMHMDKSRTIDAELPSRPSSSSNRKNITGISIRYMLLCFCHSRAQVNIPSASIPAMEMESPAIIDLNRRADVLYQIREKLKTVEKSVLNIRVGGNDLCHAFGFRRHKDESIHKILPVANIFADIITVFGTDYVISGPVWEYYSQIGWDLGLCRELSDDKLCGFTGKTVIHPNQIPHVNQAYAVSLEDLNDAKAILNWDKNDPSFVSASADRQRMNEYKTHANWAKKILFLSQIYGVKSPEP